MKDTLKARYNGEVYSIGWFSPTKGKIQIKQPIKNCTAASYVKVVNIQDVTFL